MENIVLTLAQKNENYARLINLTDGNLEREWSQMLFKLRGDSFEKKPEPVFLGMFNAPAAKGNHHAYEGGLVAHMLEMFNFYLDLEKTLPKDPLINRSSVLKGIICHDLHKSWKTFIRDDTVPSGLNYGFHPSNNLVTNDQKSMYILSQAGIKLNLVEANVLYASEGGWAESPPKWTTTLAKLVYLLDELSGNVKARSEQGNTMNLRDAMGDPSMFEIEF